MAKRKGYQVITALPVRKRYQEEILSYLSDNFSFERASEIDDNIMEMADTLSAMPQRGRIEKLLESKNQDFRFILHKETRNVEIKIIYYIDEDLQEVYITDFFPVLMLPSKVKHRS